MARQHVGVPTNPVRVEHFSCVNTFLVAGHVRKTLNIDGINNVTTVDNYKPVVAQW